MKKLYIIFAILAACLVCSCKKEEAPFIKVDKDAVELDVNGTAVDVGVSSNLEWYLETSADWIKVKRNSSGGGIMISAAKNTSTEGREGTVTIKGQGAPSVSVKVSQVQMNSVSVTTSTVLTFDETAQNFSINISYNTPYKIDIPSDAGWLTMEPESKAMQSKDIVFHLAANEGKTARTAVFVISADGCQDISVTVNQTGVPQYFSFRVSGVQSFRVPSLDNKGNKATVEYDDNVLEYKAGCSLPVGTEKLFVVKSPDIQSVSFANCEGLDSIDFSGL